MKNKVNKTHVVHTSSTGNIFSYNNKQQQKGATKYLKTIYNHPIERTANVLASAALSLIMGVSDSAVTEMQKDGMNPSAYDVRRKVFEDFIRILTKGFEAASNRRMLHEE